MSIESFPSFTGPARHRWEAIAPDVRKKLLSNVWCAHCRSETTITDVAGTIERGDLVLTGRCIRCRGVVGRVIEGA
jgi:hypothetical protein